MSRRHRTTRRDANHNEIVAALKVMGCTVVDLAAVGGGAPDVLCGYHGHNVLLEIKNPARKTKGDNAAKTMKKQAEFRAAWRGHVAVVFTVDEALREVGVW